MIKTNSFFRLFAAGLFTVGIAAGCGAEAGDGDGDGDGDTDAGASDPFSLIYNSAPFTQCRGCHAPGAPGATLGIEETQDWSTRDMAFATLKGNASGLMGNFLGCNGAPLISATAEQSLIVAVFDETVRAGYTNAAAPDCDVDAISDMTLKAGAITPAVLTDLKAWIDSGAPDM